MGKVEETRGQRRGLGRGLEALIPRGSGGLQEIEVDRIGPNPAQPRQQFDTALLEQLAASIREHGVLQPVIVRKADDGGYVLIVGERRWRAAKMAGLARVPAVVKEASGQAAIEMALVENVQRADLSPLEEAGAYRELEEAYGLRQDQIAAQVGRSRSSVANRLRLLSLPPGAKALLAGGAISEGHARALLGCADPILLDQLAQRVAERGLSVRETEELVRRGGPLKPAPSLRQPQGGGAALTLPSPTEVGEGLAEERESGGETRSVLEEELQRALGTRVQIMRSRRGGRVVIHYYSEEQLLGILETLMGGG